MFPVVIWGTVSTWVGAGLTGCGFLIASLVYRRDSNLSKSVQAKKIHARIVDKAKIENPVIHVENYSEAKIFHVIAEIHRMNLHEVVAEFFDYFTLRDEGVEKLQVELGDISDDYRVTDDDAWSIDPAKSYEFKLGGISSYHRLSVSFTDLRGRRWRWSNLRADRPKLVEVKDDPIYSTSARRYTWLRHPVKTAKAFQEKRDIRQRVQRIEDRPQQLERQREWAEYRRARKEEKEKARAEKAAAKEKKRAEKEAKKRGHLEQVEREKEEAEEREEAEKEVEEKE
jgi:flagellar biosynthesis GTPase FlhF